MSRLQTTYRVETVPGISPEQFTNASPQIRACGAAAREAYGDAAPAVLHGVAVNLIGDEHDHAYRPIEVLQPLFGQVTNPATTKDVKRGAATILELLACTYDPLGNEILDNPSWRRGSALLSVGREMVAVCAAKDPTSCLAAVDAMLGSPNRDSLPQLEGDYHSRRLALGVAMLLAAEASEGRELRQVAEIGLASVEEPDQSVELLSAEAISASDPYVWDLSGVTDLSDLVAQAAWLPSTDLRETVCFDVIVDGELIATVADLTRLNPTISGIRDDAEKHVVGKNPAFQNMLRGARDLSRGKRLQPMIDFSVKVHYRGTYRKGGDGVRAYYLQVVKHEDRTIVPLVGVCRKTKELQLLQTLVPKQSLRKNRVK